MIYTQEHLAVNSTITSSRILCFSHLRWNFVFQRPQHLLIRASRNNNILFFEEPLIDDIGHPALRSDLVADHIQVLTPVFPRSFPAAARIEAQRDFLDEVVANSSPECLISWFYTPMAMQFASHIECDVCIYDCMDELAAFKDAPAELVRLEKELFARTDLVFTGGQSLFEAKRAHHHSVHAFPSSIDLHHFRQARGPMRDPADQVDIPHPRIGFSGVIDERLDADLVEHAAAAMPDVHFVMIGPVVKIDPAMLPQTRNLHWLGNKSYSDLPAYLAHWTAGWMPFALNESTRYISPTKTPEFLAAGLPVVSTAICDVVRTYGAEGLVDIADVGDFEAKLRRALLRPRKEWLDKVDAYLANTSWDGTWDAMAGHIQAAAMIKSALLLKKGA